MRGRLTAAALALGLTFCSIRDIEYLRDPSCAPNCGDAGIAPEAGVEAGVDARPPEDAAEASILDTGPPPCATDAGYRALVMCDGPIAYFRLDDQGPPEAMDEVDGAIAGAYVTASDGGITYGVGGAIAGDPDTAIHLDGNAFVGGGTALAFPNNAPYSLEAWVSPEGDNFSYRRIVERLAYDGNGMPHDGYIVYNQATVASERWVDGGVATAAGPQLGNGAYSHVVTTYDGSMLRIYANGALAASADAPTPAGDASGTFYVGGSLGPGSGWIGAIDEVAIYDYALGQEQVTAHYRAGRGL